MAVDDEVNGDSKAIALNTRLHGQHFESETEKVVIV